MKLMYLAKRARPDVLTAVSYLSTRVQYPNDTNERDITKLWRLINYLRMTKELTMKFNNNNNIIKMKAYVDASCGTHHDCKSHTGIIITVGGNNVFFRSSKQKINSNNTNHINIRYYFVDYRVKLKEIVLSYLPTVDMLADIMTKPLQVHWNV